MLFTQGSGTGSKPKTKGEALGQRLANALKREVTSPCSMYIKVKGTEGAQVQK